MFFLLFTLLMLIVFSIAILYVQLNVQVYSVKKDLSNKGKSLINFFDKEALSVYDYQVDLEVLKEKLDTLVNKSYNQVDITAVEYDEKNNYLVIYLEIRIIPVIFYDKIGILDLKIKEEVKLKMVEYNEHKV